MRTWFARNQGSPTELGRQDRRVRLRVRGIFWGGV